MSGPPGIFVLREERELLNGAPWIVRLLYEALRWRMDWRTFTVGAGYPNVSWQALAEDIEVDGHPGIVESGKPGKSQMRRANDWLVRRGLVVMRSNARQWQLIFFLPVTKRGFFERNKPDKNPTQQPDRAPQRGNAPYPDTSGSAQPDTHLGSMSNTYHYNHERGASQFENPVDNLVVPATLSPEERAQCTLMLQQSRVNGQAQELLDELAGAIEKSAIRKGPVSYFRGLIQRSEAGTFKPDKGTAIAANRARSTQEPTKRREHSPEDAPVSKARGRALSRAALAKLKGAGNGR